MSQTPFSLPLDLPPSMNVEWAIFAEDTPLAHNTAGLLHLASKAASFREFALYMRQVSRQMLRMKI